MAKNLKGKVQIVCAFCRTPMPENLAPVPLHMPGPDMPGPCPAWRWDCPSCAWKNTVIVAQPKGVVSLR